MHNSMFDVYLMLIFGIAGYFLHRAGFSLGAIVLGLILGPIAEQGFGQSLIISGGSPLIFVTRPISIAVIIIILVLLLPGFVRKKKSETVYSEIEKEVSIEED